MCLTTGLTTNDYDRLTLRFKISMIKNLKLIITCNNNIT